MNFSNLLNGIKVGDSKNLTQTFCKFSKFNLEILKLLKNLRYIQDFQVDNYNIKVNLNGTVNKTKVIKPKIGYSSNKLFGLYKNIFLGTGHLIITNSRSGLTTYQPDLKMSGIPLFYIC
jgi:ribosomal protein S8